MQCDGWSVWTRKTTRCDAACRAGGCTACDVAVHPDLNFGFDLADASTLHAYDVDGPGAQHFEPYSRPRCAKA